MTIFRIQHALQGSSGHADDMSINTFHFIHDPDPDAGMLTAQALRIRNFYAAVPSGKSISMARHMSGTFTGPGATIKFYDLSDAPPRVPLFETVDAVAYYTPDNINLPAEVAICLSFQGIEASGLSQKRRRGRIYLGPWNVDACTGTARNRSQVAEATAEVIIAAATVLWTESLAAGWTWVVYSPTNGSAVTLQNWWVDDAWDTQRRRGEKPITRETFQTS